MNTEAQRNQDEVDIRRVADAVRALFDKFESGENPLDLETVMQGVGLFLMARIGANVITKHNEVGHVEAVERYHELVSPIVGRIAQAAVSAEICSSCAVMSLTGGIAQGLGVSKGDVVDMAADEAHAAKTQSRQSRGRCTEEEPMSHYRDE